MGTQVTDWTDRVAFDRLAAAHVHDRSAALALANAGVSRATAQKRGAWCVAHPAGDLPQRGSLLLRLAVGLRGSVLLAGSATATPMFWTHRPSEATGFRQEWT